MVNSNHRQAIAHQGIVGIVPFGALVAKPDASVNHKIAQFRQQGYQELLAEVARRFPRKVNVKLTFDDDLAHRIVAGADLFLIPSRFEPCGRYQLASLRYGTVPFVHETGGLADTVANFTAETYAAGRATGFTFAPYTAGALVERFWQAIQLYSTAPDIWRRLQVTGMRQDFSWERSARQYAEVYQLAIDRAAHREEPGT